MLTRMEDEYITVGHCSFDAKMAIRLSGVVFTPEVNVQTMPLNDGGSG